MAKFGNDEILLGNGPKKTKQGNGKFTRRKNKGSCSLGGKTSKGYRKKYRGQGRRRRR